MKVIITITFGCINPWKSMFMYMGKIGKLVDFFTSQDQDQLL